MLCVRAGLAARSSAAFLPAAHCRHSFGVCGRVLAPAAGSQGHTGVERYEQTSALAAFCLAYCFLLVAQAGKWFVPLKEVTKPGRFLTAVWYEARGARRTQQNTARAWTALQTVAGSPCPLHSRKTSGNGAALTGAKLPHARSVSQHLFQPPRADQTSDSDCHSWHPGSHLNIHRGVWKHSHGHPAKELCHVPWICASLPEQQCLSASRNTLPNSALCHQTVRLAREFP